MLDMFSGDQNSRCHKSYYSVIVISEFSLQQHMWFDSAIKSNI